MDKNFLLNLYSKSATIFTVDEIAQLSPGLSYESLRDRLYYFTKVGKLKRLRQGIYAKDSYNPLELANKLYAPSYISLETVLTKGGVVFQYYETIFAVSYLTREISVDKIKIQYRQIATPVLTNPIGIEKEGDFYIASLERAFLDAIYIYKNYHFDNLRAINWEKALELKKIYDNNSFNKRVEEYYRIYKEENA